MFSFICVLIFQHSAGLFNDSCSACLIFIFSSYFLSLQHPLKSFLANLYSCKSSMFLVCSIVRQPCPLFCSNPDLDYIVFFFAEYCCPLEESRGCGGVTLGQFQLFMFFKMAANSLSENVTFSRSALEICIIPLLQLNWPREAHFRHYFFIHKLNSGLNPRWPPPLHWQFTFWIYIIINIIRSMTFRYRYLVPVYNFLSLTSDFTKAITFGGIALDSNIN